MKTGSSQKTLVIFNMGDRLGNKVGSGHVRTAMLRRSGGEKTSEKFNDVLGKTSRTEAGQYEALDRTTHINDDIVDYIDGRKLTDEATKTFTAGMYDHIIILGGGGSVLNAAKNDVKSEDDQKIKHQIDMVKAVYERNKNPDNKPTHITAICLGAEIVAAAIDGTPENNHNIVEPQENGTEFGMPPMTYDADTDQSTASTDTQALYAKIKEAWKPSPEWQWHSNGFKNPETSLQFLKNADKPDGAETPYDKAHESSQGFVLAQENGATMIAAQSHPEATKDFHLKEGKQWMPDHDESQYAATKKEMCADADAALSNQATTHAEAMAIKEDDPAMNLVRMIGIVT